MLCLDGRSLDWALSHIEKSGDTDIFPRPFEFEAIRHCWKSIRSWLGSQDIKDWSVRPFRRCLSPKHRFGFRVSTQLDPLDAIVFTALIYEIGSDLEKARVPSSEEVVHSYRFLPTADGEMFDPDYTYDTFQQSSRLLVRTLDYSHVVVADIADFFPRLYFHPLENALRSAIPKKDHVNAIRNFVKQLNHNVSYGIPVGPAASRLLAELTIDDVDRVLLSEGHQHLRFMDDFRIFCKTERQAHEALALLANTLFENHGLTLQQHKTEIIDHDLFSRRYLHRDESKEQESLEQRFESILRDLGIINPYQPIDYDDLDVDTQAKIDALNLVEILREQIGKDRNLDIATTRFILRRLSQLDDDGAVDIVLEQLDRLYPVFKDVLAYLQSLRSADQAKKHRIGSKLLESIQKSVIGHLEYHRLLIFSLFTRDREWDNDGEFTKQFSRFTDEFSQRELILAMGRAGKASWFKTKKRHMSNFRPWERRAFIAAATCLPGDEVEHWHRSIARSFDQLDKAVAEWSKANPFS